MGRQNINIGNLIRTFNHTCLPVLVWQQSQEVSLLFVSSDSHIEIICTIASKINDTLKGVYCGFRSYTSFSSSKFTCP